MSALIFISIPTHLPPVLMIVSDHAQQHGVHFVVSSNVSCIQLKII
jgi:hypothetical protein